MRWFKLTLAYDGSQYAGWQVQPGQRTIQHELEEALARIAGTRVRAVASGRTDAGVHALGQVVSFAASIQLQTEVLRRAINATTPRDMFVRTLVEAPPGFHAIRDAISKRYRYVIQDGPEYDVFSRQYSWYLPQELDADAMHEAAQLLVGQHDFASFQAAGSQRASTVRTISDISARRQNREWGSVIVVEVEADGFLYNMVRNIVGTLVEIGQGGRSPSWLAEVLGAVDRKVAGATAPPHGLFLVAVRYAV